MVQNVLGKAVSKMQSAQQLDDLQVHGRQAGLGDRFFTQSQNRIVDLLRYRSDYLLDSRRMNPPIGYQPRHRFPSDLPAHWIETRKQDSPRSIINQHSNSR